MTTRSEEELKKSFQKLPEVLQDALFSEAVVNSIFEIGKKFGLTIEKIGLLGEETGYIIMGLTSPRSFISTLAERLDVENERAAAIASDINHQIFFPLREALKETHQIEITEEELQKGKEVISQHTVILKPQAPIVQPRPAPQVPPPPIMPPRIQMEVGGGVKEKTKTIDLSPKEQKPVLSPEEERSQTMWKMVTRPPERKPFMRPEPEKKEKVLEPGKKEKIASGGIFPSLKEMEKPIPPPAPEEIIKKAELQTSPIMPEKPKEPNIINLRKKYDGRDPYREPVE